MEKFLISQNTSIASILVIFILMILEEYVEQEYLKEDLKLYNSLDIGFEKTLSEWIRKIKNEN